MEVKRPLNDTPHSLNLAALRWPPRYRAQEPTPLEIAINEVCIQAGLFPTEDPFTWSIIHTAEGNTSDGA